jgi:glycosyltransferase involved in cell wall biosynthesis
MRNETQPSSVLDAPEVLHVLPFDQPRGAQRYARSLIDHLTAEGSRHLLLTIFESESNVVKADIALEVTRGPLRRIGLDPRAVWRLRRAYLRVRPGVVVAHGGESAKYAALALPRNAKLVYLKIGTEHPGLKRRTSAIVHRFYVKRADALVAVSAEAARELGEVGGVDRGRVAVIPNGRDPNVYKPASDRGNRAKPRLIWIGQLDTSKRPEWFVEVVGALRSAGRDVDGVLVGDGPRRAELQSMADASGVEMMGHRDDIPSLLAESDVLVFTGTPPEGMPGVLIEAGLCGIPAVSTRVPGAEDVIEDGVTGALVAVEDFAGLAATVTRLLDNAGLRETMGRRGRERCVDRFSLDATATRWRQVFHDVVDHPGRSKT